MTLHRLTAWFLPILVAGSLFSQAAADNTTRNLTQEGVSFKLPAGWQWQGEVASNIAIKKDCKYKDQTITITAELVYQAEAFLEDSIANIEKKVTASKGDLKDLKTARGEKFNGNPAAVVTLTRVRGDKHDQFEDERNYLFRRNNALYTWTERNAREVASEASLAFSAARSAIAFTQKDVAKANATKEWKDAGIKYTIPSDFELREKMGEPSKGHEEVTLIHEATAVTIKGQTLLVGVSIHVSKGDETPDAFAKRLKTDFANQFDPLTDWVTDDKQTFRGEKAVLVTFKGVHVDKEEQAKPKDPNAPKRDPVAFRTFIVKHKGYIMRWVEAMPPKQDPAVEAAFKRARDGLTFQ